MTIVKRKKNKSYTVLSNYHLKDNQLSLKAKGLLSIMLGLPDDWDYSASGLETLSNDGETSTRTALQELENNGYLTRERIKDDKGKIIDWEYTVYESPKKSKPVDGNPVGEIPQLENQGQYNTYKYNTYKYKNRDISNNSNELLDISQKEKMFDEFWQLYPKKTDKKKAHDKFLKIVTDEMTFNEIILGAKRTVVAQSLAEGNQYVPMPSTWLNGERWNDEPYKQKQKKGNLAF